MADSKAITNHVGSEERSVVSESPRVASGSSGDPLRHLSLDQLESGLETLGDAPTDVGRLATIVRRTNDGLRDTPLVARLTREGGLEGDRWRRDPSRKPEAQLTVVRLGVAQLIANGQPLTVFGDQLFIELDLSARNLPVGSRVKAGKAVLEVTPEPHNACQKFRSRFGTAALRFVSGTERRQQNLRGVYMRVIEDGEVVVGDSVVVVRRGTPPALD